MEHEQHRLADLVIIGGGINGVGLARDAAGRGLKVVLCEMDDLGWATSSRSSKLIHGGLRYLEHGELRLVREALAEREVLLRNARHICWPLRFRLPHRPHLRPLWLLRLGLFLYDHLSLRTTLPGSQTLEFDHEGPLQPQIHRGLEYSDGWVDDARLVILNALSAHQLGADIRPRTTCLGAHRGPDHWRLLLQDRCSGLRYPLHARLLINAAGPWAAQVLQTTLAQPTNHRIRLVKGSHIIVPRLHDQPEAYILQHDDQRVVFVIPYEDDFSLIGTTDVDYQGDPADASISDAEIDYLLDVSNRYFRHSLHREDLLHSYAGVRPLIDDQAGDAQQVSRDYRLELDSATGKAPLLSIFGGKITTYRKLAEAAIDQLTPFFPDLPPGWTADAPLPGARFSSQPALRIELKQHYPWLPDALLQRYIRSYGTLCLQFLQGCNRLEDLGEHFGAGLYAAEVIYLQQQEWALSCEDILWRRSKLGLRLNTAQRQQLADFLHEDSHQASA